MNSTIGSHGGLVGMPVGANESLIEGKAQVSCFFFQGFLSKVRISFSSSVSSLASFVARFFFDSSPASLRARWCAFYKGLSRESETSLTGRSGRVNCYLCVASDPPSPNHTPIFPPIRRSIWTSNAIAKRRLAEGSLQRALACDSYTACLARHRSVAGNPCARLLPASSNSFALRCRYNCRRQAHPPQPRTSPCR